MCIMKEKCEPVAVGPVGVRSCEELGVQPLKIVSPKFILQSGTVSELRQGWVVPNLFHICPKRRIY